ncbi:MAG: hypothetical protein ACYC1X_09405 [Coriobacteriia bacterium]|jgi:hypothetical protein|nr:hypothetical protein [Propionibacteriaceae bacterium]
MSVYASRDLYRIVAADGGGVRVVMPGGLATTALEEWYPSANAAAAAIADAIKGGMPAFEVVDETAASRASRA